MHHGVPRDNVPPPIKYDGSVATDPSVRLMFCSFDLATVLFPLFLVQQQPLNNKGLENFKFLSRCHKLIYTFWYSGYSPEK